MSMWQNIIVAAIAVAAAAGSVALWMWDNRQRKTQQRTPYHRPRVFDVLDGEYVDHGHETVVMHVIDPEATQVIPLGGGVR